MGNQANRLLGADFVRASACMIVLFHHLTQKIDFRSPLGDADIAQVLANGGTFGVGIFFVLSGFLLARPFWQALDRGEPMPSLRIYTLRRAARILPGFWTALTVTFVLSILVWGATPDIWLWVRYLAGFFLVSDWHWLTFFPVEVNGPLWSIGFEATSYILLPLGFLGVFALAGRLPGWAMRMVFLGVPALALLGHLAFSSWVVVDPYRMGWEYGLQGGAKTWMPWFNPFAFFAMFSVGALAGGLQVQFARIRHWAMDIVCLGALVAVAIYMWGEAYREAGELYGWLQVPYRFPTMHLLIGLVLLTGPSTVAVGRLLDNPVTRFVAQISFGIYIYHTIVIELIQIYFVPKFVYGTMTDGPLWLMAVAASVGLSVTIATASYRWLEAPVIRWARGLEQATPALARPQPA
ncbi:acyltransferase [uncultured Devosia sp.]|uniref:acyltransferase family protein n=1 Tax=uncultured Devosia sp. TaxID=211434 RepID=UPI00262A5ECD|nr:acyltransferase [uncultured Devosia sp.]